MYIQNYSRAHLSLAVLFTMVGVLYGGSKRTLVFMKRISNVLVPLQTISLFPRELCACSRPNAGAQKYRVGNNGELPYA